METIQRKEKFIDYILTTEVFSRREISWILHYMKNHPSILEQVHFVEKAERTPRGIRVSAVAFNKNTPITLFKDGKKFFDVDQIFHEIRSHWQKPLYVEIVFHNPWQTPLYLEILEDNPYATWNETIDEELEKDVTRFFTNWQKKNTVDVLRREINQALDDNDEERFNALTKQYNEQRRHSVYSDL